MIIDGVIGSEAVDSSAEILDVGGADIDGWKDGTMLLDWEHDSEDEYGPSALVGKVVYAHKVFKESDCENERERHYWKQIRVPFIYGLCRLFDEAGHKAARDLAAIIRDAVKHGDLQICRFSVEGHTLERKGQRLLETLVKRVAVTVKPANKSSMAGIVEDADAPEGFEKKPEEVADDELKQILQMASEDAKTVKKYERLGSGFGDEVPAGLAKTITAGITSGAPSTLTGGAALQREDQTVARRRKFQELLRQAMDLGPDKSSREFAKMNMEGVDDAFLDHFERAVDGLRVKIGRLKKSDPQPVAPAPLTIRGKPAGAGVGVIPGAVRFDEVHGVVHTAGGAFPLIHPDRDPDRPRSGDQLRQALRSDVVRDVHDRAMANWQKLNQALRDDRMPSHLRQAVQAFQALGSVPVHEIIRKSSLDGAAGARRDARAGIPLGMTRVGQAMAGSGNVLVLDDHLVRHLFGLDHAEGATVAHLRRHLARPKAIEGLERWYSKEHPAVQHVLEHPKFGAQLRESPDQALLPASWAHWLAIAPHDRYEAMAKSVSPHTHPLRAATDVKSWMDRDGPVAATLRFHAYLAPLLCPELFEPPSLAKAEALSVEMMDVLLFAQRLKKAEGDLRQTAPERPTAKTRLPCPNACVQGVKDGSVCFACGGAGTVAPSAPVSETPTEPVLDADVHGDPQLNTSPEQRSMIHGLKLSPLHKPLFIEDGINEATTFWTKLPDGTRGIVKPAKDGDEARNEVAYHNVARDFFGLGAFVQPTAAFHHPTTGVMHSVQAEVPEPRHFDLKDIDPQGWIRAHLENGDLDKLGMMNLILGNRDRHTGNYLTTPSEPHLRLIDHGYAFRGWGRSYVAVPDYLHEAAHSVGQSSGLIPSSVTGDIPTAHSNVLQTMSQPMHPAATAWLHSLDPNDLGQRLQSMAIDGHGQAMGLLQTLQAHLRANPAAARRDLYNLDDVRHLYTDDQ